MISYDSKVLIKGDATKTPHKVYGFVRCAEGWAIQLYFIPRYFLDEELVSYVSP